MRRTPSPRLCTRKKILLLPPLSLFEKNFFSPSFYYKISRGASLWHLRTSNKISKKSLPKRHGEGAWCVDVGASNSWMPPPCFWATWRREGCLLFSHKRREGHSCYDGCGFLMMKREWAWGINSTWVDFKLVKSYSK